MNRRAFLFLIALLALVAGVYAPMFAGGAARLGPTGAGLLWKDAETLRQGAETAAWNFAPATPPPAANRETPIVWPPRAPVAATLLRWEYRAWGENALGYRAVSLLLHLISTLLLWRLLCRVRLPAAAAALGAALWAVHPVNVEAVAWIAQQGTVLAWMLALLAAHLWLAARDRQWLLIFAWLPAAAAMLASPLMLPLPLGLLLLTWAAEARITWRDGMGAIPPAALAVIAGVWRHQQQAHFPRPPGVLNLGAMDGVLRAMQVAGAAAWHLAAPVGLSLVYPRFGVPGAGTWAAGAALAILMVLALLRIRRRRGARSDATGWASALRAALAAALWFFLALVPVIGWINGPELQWSALSDHFSYAAGTGVFAMVAAGAAAMTVRRRAWQRGVICVCAVALVGLATLGARRAYVFSTPESLYRDTLAKNPGAAIIAEKLADLLVARDHARAYPEAAALYASAAKNAPWLTSAACAWARILDAQGQPREAQQALQKCLADNPNDPRANALLGDMLVKSLGTVGESGALKYYERAYAAAPEDAAVAAALGRIYLHSGRLGDARAVLEKSAPLNPHNGALHLQLANVQVLLGDYRAANVQYELGTALDPANAEAFCTWGLMWMDAHEPFQAESRFRRAVALQPENPKFHMHLGRALRDEQQFARALDEFHAALVADARYAPALFEAANVYLQLRDESHATALLWQALAVDKDYVDVQIALSRLLMFATDPARRDPDQALLLLRQAVQRTHEQDLSLLVAYGDALAQMKYAGEAQQLQTYLDALDMFGKALALGKRRNISGGQLELILRYQQAVEVKLLPPWEKSGSLFSLTGTGLEVPLDPPLPRIPQQTFQEAMNQRWVFSTPSTTVLDPKEALRLPESFVKLPESPYTLKTDTTGNLP